MYTRTFKSSFSLLQNWHYNYPNLTQWEHFILTIHKIRKTNYYFCFCKTFNHGFKIDTFLIIEWIMKLIMKCSSELQRSQILSLRHRLQETTYFNIVHRKGFDNIRNFKTTSYILYIGKVLIMRRGFEGKTPGSGIVSVVLGVFVSIRHNLPRNSRFFCIS